MEPGDLDEVKRLHEQCFPVRYDMVSIHPHQRCRVNVQHLHNSRLCQQTGSETIGLLWQSLLQAG